jgi:hypothetical protein
MSKSKYGSRLPQYLKSQYILISHSHSHPFQHQLRHSMQEQFNSIFCWEPSNLYLKSHKKSSNKPATMPISQTLLIHYPSSSSFIACPPLNNVFIKSTISLKPFLIMLTYLSFRTHCHRPCCALQS